MYYFMKFGLRFCEEVDVFLFCFLVFVVGCGGERNGCGVCIFDVFLLFVDWDG